MPATSPESEPATKLEKVLMWVFEADSIAKLRSLPGLTPGKENYLLDGLDQSTYREFANCPVPIRAKASPLVYMVDLRLKALHNYWWGILIGKDDLTPNVALPHPRKLDVSPAVFMDLYLPENHKKDNYGRITLVNPQNPAVKYEGKPAKFQRFYESLKAAAANTSANLLRCIESKPFADSAKELNNVLYNWVVGNVDQQTVERHFYPNKGDGHAALKSLAEDPAVIAHKQAEVNVSKREIETLKCKGTDVASYISKFEVLAKRGQITDDAAKVDLFIKGFDESSPYWDKLTRLRETKPSLGEIITGLNNFYASIVSAKVLHKGNGKLDDEDGEATSKRIRKRKGGDEKGKTPKKPKEGPAKVDVPRIVAKDYKKLSAKERSELQTTGKLSAYTMVESTEHEGKYKLTKKDGSGTAGKTTKVRRVVNGQEEDSISSKDDDSTKKTLDILDAIAGTK
jgi:mRNA-degrading endonuclease RelE of RelBE toxin-antitoxin system